MIAQASLGINSGVAIPFVAPHFCQPGTYPKVLTDQAGQIDVILHGTVLRNTGIIGPAQKLNVKAPAAAASGVAFTITVTAQDAYNNTATGYVGTVGFTGSDGSGVYPGNATLTSGVKAFTATLVSAGNQTITGTDTVSSSVTGKSGVIVVT